MNSQSEVAMTNENQISQEITAAVVRQKGGPFAIEKLKIENLNDDEVLVKIVATGMCHTDMVVRDQAYPVPLPLVLGHEGSGVVEKVGKSVGKVEVGDHVALTFHSCGHCRSCLKGEPTYCMNFYSLNFGGGREDGTTALTDKSGAVHDHFFGQSSFATYAVANQRNVVKVPKDVPLELLGPLGCGIQTGAGAVLNALKVRPGESLAVFGAGAVGLSAIMAAKAAGVTTIIAIDVVPARLELAKELGASHAVNSKEKNVVEEIQKITDGGVNYSLEATGIPAVLRQAVDALGVRGTCGFVGAPALGTEAKFDVNSMMLPGKKLIGIIEGDSVPEIFIPQLISLYKRGLFPFDRLIKFYSMKDINQAAEDSEKGITVKPIIRFS